MKWQPIRTAPECGRVVLLLHPIYGMAIWPSFGAKNAASGGFTHWKPRSPLSDEPEIEATMDRETAFAKLKALQSARDTEMTHMDADEVLCDLLTALGYADVVAEFDLVDKWYT